MDIGVASVKDIAEIEKLSRQCFEKFNFKGLGLEYCSKAVSSRIKNMIDQDSFVVFVGKKSGRVVGFLISHLSPTLYSDSQFQLTEIAMQSHPSLSQTQQGKVLLSLIKKQEEYADKNNISIRAFSICPQFDIGKHLERKKYVISDKLYIKRKELS